LFERKDVPDGLWRLMFGSSLGWHAEEGAAGRYLHLLPPLPIVTALSE